MAMIWNTRGTQTDCEAAFFSLFAASPSFLKREILNGYGKDSYLLI